MEMFIRCLLRDGILILLAEVLTLRKALPLGALGAVTAQTAGYTPSYLAINTTSGTSPMLQ